MAVQTPPNPPRWYRVALATLIKRQNDGGDLTHPPHRVHNDWEPGFGWNSKAGTIVRWVIFFLFVFTVLLYFIGGYYLARHRIRKGLPPHLYHRWMVGRSHGGQPQGQNAWPQQQNGYYQPPMHPLSNMGPPPMYDPNHPPTYSAHAGPPPAQGNTKIDPWQWRSEPTNRPAEANAAPGYGQPAASTPSASRNR